ncbi:MAG: GntR family transcriptional regulator [Oscillospiraceae bacterium]|nr:GntR family transcriptional regulator [Oscillospiraceae bacterium]
MVIKSIQKKEKVTDQVFSAIKDLLMRGDLKPGDKLPAVNEMAEKMGVGISSVLVAVKMLETLGAVEARQGEGTFVCTELKEGVANALGIQFLLLPQSAEYLVQFREMYETAYTHMAMDNATSEDLAEIEKIVMALEDRVRKESQDTLVEAQDELDFHMSVLRCTHNPYIIKIGEASLELFFEVMHSKIRPLKLIEAAMDHRNIYLSLLNKDTELLKKVFVKSFGGWRDRFKAYVNDENKK